MSTKGSSVRATSTAEDLAAIDAAFATIDVTGTPLSAGPGAAVDRSE
jgi:hypothetical protein